MSEHFVLNEYIWSVTVENKDDGHRIAIAHFTDQGKAYAFARKKGGAVVQVSLWRDPRTDQYYRIRTERVPVDIPEEAEVLAKLTRHEKEALGLI